MQQPDCLAAVAEFHRLFQAPILRVPTIPSADRCALRVNLIREELNELADAIKENDLVEVADALADIQYVLSGAVLEFGFGATFELLFNEVQRSNMSKACANPHEAEATRAHYKAKQGVDSFVEQLSESQFLVFRAGDKKVLKSVNYSPANLPPILSCAGEVAAGGAATVLPMPNTLNAVAAFHRLFKAPILPTPQIPAADRCALRVSLITEELQELEDAIKEKDLIEIADALADIQYVLSGAVLEFGMGDQFEALFDEVHRSNMSKACATADEAEATRQHYRENYNPPTESTIEEVEGKFLVFRAGDRKVLKSVKYSPADLAPLVKASLPPAAGASGVEGASNEVPIKQVARVARMQVGGEDAASKLDSVVRSALPAVRALPGFVTATRQVCKSEWVYELAVIFASKPDFDAYMQSEFGPTLLGPAAAKAIQDLAAGEVAFGNRVHDKFA